MSDEMRDTRLLKFRPRGGAGGGTQGTGDPRAGEDPELSTVLGTWAAPEPPPEMDARLLAAYRAATAHTPLWRRMLTSGVRVPLPVAACLALALVASLLAHVAHPGLKGEPPGIQAGTHAQPAPEIRIVEVPVPSERVVTRVVYAERGRANARNEASRARAKSRRADDPANAPAGGAASYFTPVDMAEFKPADEVKIRVVRKGER
jgi:hypothetical protein